MKSSFNYFAFLSLIALGTWRQGAAQTPVPPAPAQPLQTSQPMQQGQLDLSLPLTLDRVLARFSHATWRSRPPAIRVESARADQIAARLHPNPSILFTAENFKVQGNSPFTVPFESSTKSVRRIRSQSNWVASGDSHGSRRPRRFAR